jgi:hypothetical protein
METTQDPNNLVISDITRVFTAQNQVWTDLGSEIAILNLDTGIYYGLNEVGADVWNFISEPRTVLQIHGHIRTQYDVDSDRCFRDLVALLKQLAEAGLIKLLHENSG